MTAGELPFNLTLNCSMPYETHRVPLVLLYSLVFLVGVPANLVTVWMTLVQVRRKNVLGIYLFSLSVCDLMYLCTLPLWGLYIYRRHTWEWGSVACKWTGYIFFNNMYISIFLLCCVSVDRYVAVVYSLESRGSRKTRHAWAITAAIVLFVALIHVQVFNMDEGSAGAQRQQRCFEPGQNSAMVTGFNYARFLIGFLVPFCILVATNRTILSSIQRSDSIKVTQKVKVRRLALCIVAMFLVCFAPYHGILLSRAISFHTVEDKCAFDKSLYTAYSICLGLSTINSAMNPILYVLSSDNVRKEVRRAMSSIRSWGSSQRPQVTDSSAGGQQKGLSAASESRICNMGQ